MNTPSAPVLETARLILRPVESSDAPFIQQHFSRPEVLEFLPPEVPNPYPADGAEFYLNHIMLPAMQAGKAMEFMVLRKSDNTPVGTVMVDSKNDTDTTWRIGFWLSPDHRGNGYMNEASVSAMHWLFANTPATEVITGNASTNTASARIQEKNGFLPLGTRVQMPPFRNGDTQAMDWSLPRDHFFSLHGTSPKSE